MDVAYRYLPAGRPGWAATGSTSSRCPAPGSRWSSATSSGHGLHAAATMGRLRTAVHNFSALDLPPDELLGHLDELVARIDQDERATDRRRGRSPEPPACTRSTTRSPARARMARAGHPGPALVRPDGTVDFPEVPVGPPLGLGGLPFETAELHAARGQPAGAVHRRAGRGPRPGHRRRPARCCADPGRGRGPHARGDLPGGARRDAARHARATTSPCWSPAPACWTPRRSPSGTCPPTRRRSPRVRAACARAAGRLGPGGDRLHHRADPQRAGHQRHPLRHRARSGCGCCATAA